MDCRHYMFTFVIRETCVTPCVLSTTWHILFSFSTSDEKSPIQRKLSKKISGKIMGDVN